MCGRFVLKTLDAVFDEFDVEQSVALAASYNIAPTHGVAAVRAGAEGAGREVAVLHWGLIPPWAKGMEVGNKMINARAETLLEKPVFRVALQRRRCLIPADGFYEWKREGKGKRPFYIHRKDGRLIAFAGLWERWRDDAGHALDSCTIITTRPNELMRGIHDRMPAIIEPGAYERWLNPTVAAEDVTGLLEPVPAAELDAYEVGRGVNSPKNNSADCMIPVATGGNGEASLFG